VNPTRTIRRAHALHARPLTPETLPLHAQRISVPTYDRAALTPAIVHFGVGGFHRAHQAMYLDELARGGVTDWGRWASASTIER